MKTDRNLLFKALKYIGYTFILMFTAPTIIYQAFKNEEHFLYIPVLVIGLTLALTAISLGFYSIKILMDSFFGKKK